MMEEKVVLRDRKGSRSRSLVTKVKE